jgi:hypothetical protein
VAENGEAMPYSGLQRNRIFRQSFVIHPNNGWRQSMMSAVSSSAKKIVPNVSPPKRTCLLKALLLGRT